MSTHVSGDPRLVDRLADYQPTTPRERARQVAVSIVAGLQRLAGGTAAGLARNRVHFLYLHSVFADEEEGFRTLLARLAQTHTFISYSESVARVRSGILDRPYVTFSFDDGMRNNLRAASILDEHGAKACFFVCPGIVGETRFERLDEFCRGQLHYPPVAFLDWDDIVNLLERGHEVGSHTRRHPQLSTLDVTALEDEVAGSRADLAARIGGVSHFAWPYGRFSDAPSGLGEIVARAGYDSCASAVRGCHVAAAGDDRAALCIRRDQIVAKWPLSHNLYFLARSAKAASDADNRWPAPAADGPT